jgi:flagellar hook-associated protein 3 FlgL
MSSVVGSLFAQHSYHNYSLARLRAEMQVAQDELSSGVVSDLPRQLGSRAGSYASLERRVSSLEAISSSNSILRARFQATDAALGALDGSISQFRSLLLSNSSGAASLSKAVKGSEQLFESAVSFLNSSYAGRYIFAGVDSNKLALVSGSGMERVADVVADSFLGRFGVALDSEEVADVSAESLIDWVETDFSQLFESPSWEGLFTNVSGNVPKVRIGEDEFLDGGVSVNDPAFRKLVMSFLMMTEVGSAKLNETAAARIGDRALMRLEEANSGIIALRSKLGAWTAGLEDRDRSLSLQRDLLRSEVSELSHVDPVEASLRIESLRTRLEASYTLTARLNNLSLLNYL